MEALTTTGFTLAEGGGTPRFPSTMVLNDYISGYIGAAGFLPRFDVGRKRAGSYACHAWIGAPAPAYRTVSRLII